MQFRLLNIPISVVIMYQYVNRAVIVDIHKHCLITFTLHEGYVHNLTVGILHGLYAKHSDFIVHRFGCYHFRICGDYFGCHGFAMGWGGCRLHMCGTAATRGCNFINPILIFRSFLSRHIIPLIGRVGAVKPPFILEDTTGTYLLASLRECVIEVVGIHMSITYPFIVGKYYLLGFGCSLLHFFRRKIIYSFISCRGDGRICISGDCRCPHSRGDSTYKATGDCRGT